MIYFMRHGLDDERLIGGWSNEGLTDKGKKQVEDAIIYLKQNPIFFHQIYSSDLERAKETAEMIQKEYKTPIILDERLREQNKGDFNGVFALKAKLENPEFFQNITEDTFYPNGESLRSFWERIKINLSYFLEQDDTLIVTHRGIINYLYYQMNDMDIDMDKKQFGVTHTSIHEYNPKTKQIRKLY